jgi:hypothetical protein
MHRFEQYLKILQLYHESSRFPPSFKFWSVITIQKHWEEVITYHFWLCWHMGLEYRLTYETGVQTDTWDRSTDWHMGQEYRLTYGTGVQTDMVLEYRLTYGTYSCPMCQFVLQSHMSICTPVPYVSIARNDRWFAYLHIQNGGSMIIWILTYSWTGNFLLTWAGQIAEIENQTMHRFEQYLKILPWEPLIFQQNIYRRKIPQQCYRNWPNLSRQLEWGLQEKCFKVLKAVQDAFFHQ